MLLSRLMLPSISITSTFDALVVLTSDLRNNNDGVSPLGRECYNNNNYCDGEIEDAVSCLFLYWWNIITKAGGLFCRILQRLAFIGTGC